VWVAAKRQSCAHEIADRNPGASDKPITGSWA